MGLTSKIEIIIICISSLIHAPALSSLSSGRGVFICSFLIILSALGMIFFALVLMPWV